jgi:hypothetical protein
MGGEERALPGREGARWSVTGWSACGVGGGAAVSSASREGRSRDHAHRS